MPGEPRRQSARMSGLQDLRQNEGAIDPRASAALPGRHGSAREAASIPLQVRAIVARNPQKQNPRVIPRELTRPLEEPERRLREGSSIVPRRNGFGGRTPVSQERLVRFTILRRPDPELNRRTLQQALAADRADGPDRRVLTHCAFRVPCVTSTSRAAAQQQTRSVSHLRDARSSSSPRHAATARAGPFRTRLEQRSFSWFNRPGRRLTTAPARCRPQHSFGTSTPPGRRAA